MGITTATRPETPAETPSTAPRADVIAVSRAATSPFEHAIIAAVRAAYWKQDVDVGPEPCSESLAAGVAIEIERRCRVFDTPVEVSVCRGIVSPLPDIRESVAEAPSILSGDLSMPGWASESEQHTWIETTGVGTDDRLFVDPSVPPQVTGQPGDAARDRPFIVPITAEGDAPAAYETRERGVRGLSLDSDLEVPWELGTETWPFGTPAPVSPVPCDGGSEISVAANTVVEIDARDGFSHLPSDSVDLIITSPPYRLQRNYPGSDAVWDAVPDCSHTWETEELYTDTPIRKEGGAGFNSSDDPAELRRDRWRDSTTCTQCGAWKGQLGLEPTLDKFIQHLITIFEQAKRVLKPTGSLWVNIGDSYADGHRDDDGEHRDAPEKALAGVPPKFELAMRDNGWIPRERCAWVKPSPTPDPAHDRRTPAWEHVYRFTLSTQYTDDTASNDVNVFDLNTASGETDHSAPMPRSLPEAIIESTFPTGEVGVVADPFAGSGTVLEAAAAAGHDYIGFEIGSDAAATARDRVAPYNAENRSLTGQSSLSSFTGE